VSRVLVLTAVDVEARGLARQLGLTAAGSGGELRFGGGALELVCVGPGARGLGPLLARAARPALVVSAGACGALAPELVEGSLVVPEAVLDEGGARFPTADVGLRRAGTLLTVTRVVATPADKARLWLESGALACDMESAPILAWARAAGVPAAVVRGVSDPATRGVPPDLAALVEPDGRVRTARAVRAVLARPRALADALALRTGTAAALRAVAQALGGLARAYA